MFRKFLAALLCLVMVFSLTAVCAFADEDNQGADAPVESTPPVEESKEKEPATVEASNAEPNDEPSFDISLTVSCGDTAKLDEAVTISATATCTVTPSASSDGGLVTSFQAASAKIDFVIDGDTKSSHSFTPLVPFSETASFDYIFSSTGSHTVTANLCQNDGTVVCSKSATVTVPDGPTYLASVAVNSDNNAVMGLSSNLLAAVVCDGSAVKGGKVIYYVDGTKVGTAKITTTGGVSGATLAYIFSTTGAHTVSIEYVDASGNVAATASCVATVYTPTTLTVSASPTWSKAPYSGTITAVLKNNLKNPIAGKTLHFKYSTSSSTTYANANEFATGVTDANGKATAALSLTKNGTYYVMVGFEGDNGELLYASLGKVTVTVSNVAPTGDDFNAPLWIAVILISVGTASYVLIRRKNEYYR